MDINIKTWLLDIIQSIDEINQFIGDNNDFAAYKKDIKTKKAVERNIEIIGEAVSRILKAEPNFKLDNAKNIIGTRNRIIHSYDNISDEVIWTIVWRELPNLKVQVEYFLDRIQHLGKLGLIEDAVLANHMLRESLMDSTSEKLKALDFAILSSKAIKLVKKKQIKIT